MKKRLLICHDHMKIGGGEKVLLEMLHRIDENEFDVSVLFVEASGEFLSSMPDYVRYSEMKMTSLQREQVFHWGAKHFVKHYVSKGKFLSAAKVFFARLKGDYTESYVKILDEQPVLNEHYDIAVCYSLSRPYLVRFVAEKVVADKKVLWMHSDFSITNYNVAGLKKYLLEYCRFFAVSEKLKDVFIKILPCFADETKVFHNLINKQDIIEKAEAPCDWDYNGIKILSVGRLSQEKGFDTAIRIAKRLKDKGYDFQWRIVGEGQERSRLEAEIEKANLKKQVILYGATTNPYPFFKACDIYCQPSRHEGYCTTVTEAIILQRPIIVTDVAGAREQLTSGVDGFIVDIDEQAIADKLEYLIDNKQVAEQFVARLKDKPLHDDLYLLSEL